MNTLEWIGAVGGAVGALAGTLGAVTAAAAARTARESNVIARQSASSAERAARATEAQFNLEEAKQAAQLVFLRVGPWAQAPGIGSRLHCEIENIGGSTATEVLPDELQFDDGTAYLVGGSMGSFVPKRVQNVDLQLSINVVAVIPAFSLKVHYSDALGEQQSILRYCPPR